MPLFARLCVVLVAASAVSTPAPARAQAAPAGDPPAYRIFLEDGTAIATAGEFARVGDRVVAVVPLTAGRQPVVTLPASAVDWTRTDRYTDAVRAARYAATRGETEFAAMSALVARTLSDIAVTPGRAAQLALAERARRILADWPQSHYEYRGDEVRQTIALLDEVISGLRAAAGYSSFDVTLVAATRPPAPEPVQGPPTLQEAIAQALRLSELAGGGAERAALLAEVDGALAEHGAALPAPWVSDARRRTSAALQAERRIDHAYTQLRTRALKAVERGGIRSLVRARARVVETDARLGRQRPREVQALLAAIDERLDAARRLRLARDQWAARLPALRAYRDAVEPASDLLRRGRDVLQDIRALAGPPIERLSALLHRVGRVAPVIRSIPVPAEARPVHASILHALQLAETAARYRERAVLDNDMRVAWDASAAAAGALLLAERADADLARLLQAPE